MLLDYILIAFIGYIAGTIFVFLLKRSARKYKVLNPQGIPLIGGIAMGLSFIIASFAGTLFYTNLSREAGAIIAASFIMLVFGAIDDWKELSIPAKFLVQVIATAVLIFFGVKTQIAYIGDIANIIITFIWVLGIANAFNHLDVMDGLSAGCAIIVSSAFFVIAILNNEPEVAILSLALTVSAVSFLRHNFPPAKIYMGNSGSHFLGFALAAIAIIISYAPLERKIALFSPLFILGFPIFDTAYIVMARIIKRSLPFKKSNDHPALKLLALGYSKKKALSIMLGICLLFSLCGICLSQVSNFLGTIIIACVAFVSIALTKKIIKVAV